MATAQINNVVQLGGVDESPSLILPEGNVAGYFTIYASNAALAAIDRVYPFYKNGALYQVTGGTTFKCIKIISWGAQVAYQGYQLLTDTATFAPDATAASLTAPVYQAGASVRYPMIAGNLNGASYVHKSESITYDFAASTWPGIQVGTPNNNYIGVFIIGKEV